MSFLPLARIRTRIPLFNEYGMTPQFSVLDTTINLAHISFIERDNGGTGTKAIIVMSNKERIVTDHDYEALLEHFNVPDALNWS